MLSLLLLVCLMGCNKETSILERYKDAKIIQLNKEHATINNDEIEEFDYTWHVDPNIVHEDVKDAPAEYYTGEKPSDDLSIYIDHELYYYPEVDESAFTLKNYDGEQEWVTYYSDGEHDE